MLKPVGFDDLPEALRQSLLSCTCELAIYDEFSFFTDGVTFWVENSDVPAEFLGPGETWERQASRWTGAVWGRLDWGQWLAMRPAV